MSENELLKSALHEQHVKAGAKMGDEAGWLMPLSFSGALEETAEVHRRAGVFDVSHFGRIRIRGDAALDLLERACTSDVAHQEDNTTAPTLLCNDSGGVIDLCRLIRLPDFWVLVTSPACRQKVLEHLTHLAGQFGAKVDDQTPKTSMLAVTGPTAGGILDAVLPFKVADMLAGEVKFGSIMIARYIAERVSFSGEWGAEVAVPNMLAGRAWRFITEKAGQNNIPPAGTVAWDVLRIEAGICRYGHELNETTDPYTCGLESAVDFGHDFIGAEAVAKVRDSGPTRKRVGLVLDEKDQPPDAPIPNMGSPVAKPGGREVGAVTSGTFSPTLQKAIAMAYVEAGASEVGTQLQTEGRLAGVVELPFYRAE